jgi:hypothetical protein
MQASGHTNAIRLMDKPYHYPYTVFLYEFIALCTGFSLVWNHAIVNKAD